MLVITVYETDRERDRRAGKRTTRTRSGRGKIFTLENVVMKTIMEWENQEDQKEHYKIRLV